MELLKDNENKAEKHKRQVSLIVINIKCSASSQLSSYILQSGTRYFCFFSSRCSLSYVDFGELNVAG